jgi:hypothetical protein
MFSGSFGLDFVQAGLELCGGGRAGRIKLMIVLNFGLIKNIEWEMINCAW